MTTALLVVAILATLACPLHGFLRMRRGRPGCAGGTRTDEAALRTRLAELSDRIWALEADPASHGRD